MLHEVGAIFGNVVLPILLIIGLGAAVERRHPLDILTLSKLNIYLFVPAFLFVRVLESDLGWREIAGITVAILLTKVLLALPLWWALRRLRADNGTIAVVVLSSAIFNAGNFGIPVAERAFGSAGGSVQALVVMLSNLTVWGIGYGLMGAVAGRGQNALVEYLKLPMLYVVVAAFLLRGLNITLPEPLLYPARLIADGLVAVALVTLGSQLAKQARWPRWRIISPVLILKLLALPAIMAGVVWALRLWPWPGAMLIVAAAGPTAVNTLLIAIEQGGDAELAADAVFWTTLLSALSVTLILTVVKLLGGGP